MANETVTAWIDLYSLSRTQSAIVRLIELGAYTPSTMDLRSRRALIAKGVIAEHDGTPRTYTLTDAARAALSRARGEA